MIKIHCFGVLLYMQLGALSLHLAPFEVLLIKFHFLEKLHCLYHKAFLKIRTN